MVFQNSLAGRVMLVQGVSNSNSVCKLTDDCRSAGETGFTTSGVGKMRYGNSPNKPSSQQAFPVA